MIAIRAGACTAALGALGLALLVGSSSGDSTDEPLDAAAAVAAAVPEAAPAATSAPAETSADTPPAAGTTAPVETAVDAGPFDPGDGPPISVGTADGVRHVRPAQGDSTLSAGFILAAGLGTEAIVNIGSDGDDHTVTRILVQTPGEDDTAFVRTVPGAWQTPTTVPGAAPEGFAWDGSRIVLQDYDDPGRFVAVPTDDPRAKPLVVHPEGRFVYDALSSDGNTLFLTELQDAAGRDVYRIRAVDLRTGRLAPDPVVDKQSGGEAMAGDPVARASSRGFAYTVYTGGQETFVHALATDQGIYSLCLDLPEGAGDPSARNAWSIAVGLDGQTVVAANGVLGMAYVVRAEGGVMPIELAGHADGPPPVAVASATGAWVLTDAGLERLDLAAGRATTQPAPKAAYGLLATARGVLVLGGAYYPITLLPTAS